MEVEIF